VQIAHAGGGHQITLRLDPGELGHVDIRIERAADGSAAIQVTVERPETLKLMLADQPQLHRALDAAGLPQDGRSLTLSLATPNPGGGGNHPGPSGGGFGAAGGQGGSQGGGQAGANTRQGQQQGRALPPPPQSGAASPWMRAGVDITA
jgi:flagellar hook-length control protein FliK